MHKVTRRSFMSMGAAALVPLPVILARPAYRFFAPVEARFIEAACDRLIPADPSGPGALGAGVPYYLDEHLRGSWGAGLRLYRSGGWQPGSPLRLPCTPAELFRKALVAIDRELGKRGIVFSHLPHAAQDRFLLALQRGEVRLEGVPATRFFEVLLTMTVEGFFTSPRYGTTRDRVAWRLAGFPGAFAAAVDTAPGPAVAPRLDSGLVSPGFI